MIQEKPTKNRQAPMPQSKDSQISAVIIVDDEKENAQYLAELIETELSSKTFIAGSGNEAIQVIAKLRNEGKYFIDTIISDIQMPGISGHEFLLELVSSGVYVPVIFVSGYQDIQSALTALRLSAFDFFSKPIDPTQFIETVKIAISKGQRFRSIGGGFSSLQVENLASSATEAEKTKIAQIADDMLRNWRMTYLLGLRNSRVKK